MAEKSAEKLRVIAPAVVLREFVADDRFDGNLPSRRVSGRRVSRFPSSVFE